MCVIALSDLATFDPAQFWSEHMQKAAFFPAEREEVCVSEQGQKQSTFWQNISYVYPGPHLAYEEADGRKRDFGSFKDCLRRSFFPQCHLPISNDSVIHRCELNVTESDISSCTTVSTSFEQLNIC